MAILPHGDIQVKPKKAQVEKLDASRGLQIAPAAPVTSATLLSNDRFIVIPLSAGG
jgi:hypothetical protein